MHRISNLPVPLQADFSALGSILEKATGAPAAQFTGTRLIKKSVDARDKASVRFVVSIDFSFAGDVGALHLPRGCQLTAVTPKPYLAPACAPLSPRPVVVGLGPAGLFAALILARTGLRPLVIERGRPVDERARDVARFFAGGPLDVGSNVQFGEGGAGAFSDGKLTTGVNDPRCAFVLHTFVQHGAPESILWDAKPHIGTDRLPGVVASIREEIVSLGGEVRFECALTGLMIERGQVVGIRAGDETLDARRVILAIGHSARDTFASLYALGVPMVGKPFSIGARIEHAQALIDRAQYGAFAGHEALGAAEYKLSMRTRAQRGVYTFCMCPGGTVVAAASEAGGVVTNGMSAYARDGQNANSALLVSVGPEDYGDHPLAGMEFQRKWEASAFLAGGENYRAPAQRVGDFLKKIPSKGAGDVEPSYRPGVTYGSLDRCLPAFVTDAMREGLLAMNRRLVGFASAGAVLTGVETRSSSPVRMPRGEDGMSDVRGLYPCGEGAGYAGGIMSAAVDGMRMAEALIEGGAQHD